MLRPIRFSLILGLALLCGCASPEERFAEHVRRADGFLAENREEDALLELQSALKIDPADPDVNQRLGHLLSRRGAFQPAVFHFGEAYRLDPSRVDAAMRQAALLWYSAPERSGRILARALESHPDDPIVHRTNSAFAVVRKNLDAALESANRAIELAPDEIENWTQLGSVHEARIRALLQQGDPPPDSLYEEALAAYRKVDELDGGHIGARLALGRVYGMWEGHREKSTEAMRSAIALARESDDDERLVVAALAMADHAARKGWNELRIEALRQIVLVRPRSVPHWEQLVRATTAAEGADAGEEIYLELIEREPELAAAHIAYTSALARRGRYAAAIEYLDETMAKSGTSALLLEQLMRLQLADGKAADARRSYSELADDFANAMPTKRAAVRLALAEGRNTEALQLLREFVGENESQETERMRADALLRLDNLPAASAAVDRAIALSGSNPLPSLRLKATIQHAAKEWRALLATLDRLEERGHTLSKGEQLMAVRALYETDRADAGREKLENLLAGPAITPGVALEFAHREGHVDPKVTRSHLAKALRYAPGNYELLEAITRLDVQTGQLERALRRLDRSVESQLAGPRILLMRSELLALSGQLERAEADALRAFEAAPELPGAVDLLFAIYQAQDRLAEAQRSFEEAESVGVLHAGARVLLGRLYAAQGDSKRARAMYEKVIAENPEIAPAKNDLAFMLASEGGDLDRALALAEDAQRAMPENANTADTVGFVYYRRGSHEAALQQFRYAIELADSRSGAAPVYHYHLGLALMALGREAEAAEAFDRTLAIDPAFADAAAARRQIEQTRTATDVDDPAPAETSPGTG